MESWAESTCLPRARELSNDKQKIERPRMHWRKSGSNAWWIARASTSLPPRRQHRTGERRSWGHCGGQPARHETAPRGHLGEMHPAPPRRCGRCHAWPSLAGPPRSRPGRQHHAGGSAQIAVIENASKRHRFHSCVNKITDWRPLHHTCRATPHDAHRMFTHRHNLASKLSRTTAVLLITMT